MSKLLKNSHGILISSQYFLYFAALGVFLPYFNLYCYYLGFSGIQIGALSSLRSMVLVVFSIIWSVIADRYQIRRSIFILCNFVSTILWTGYFFHDNFWAVFAITGCYGIFYAPIISFLEAVTIDVLGKDKISYGKIRVWGSISFIAMVLMLGYMIDYFSIKIILAVIFAGSILQSILSIRTPPLVTTRKRGFFSGAKLFFRPRVIVFLACAFLMLVSHGTYYGFFSIHLKALGFGSTFVGVAWALASLSEIIVMIKSKHIFKNVSYEKVLIFSFAVATGRWLVLGLVESPFLILLTQVLHAVTYGMFHMASVLYIDSVSPAETKTFGQAINNATTYGLGLMAGFFISGILFEHFNAVIMYFISGIIACLAGIVFAGFILMERGDNA